MDEKNNELQGKNINLLEAGLASSNKQAQNNSSKVNPLNDLNKELKELDHPDTLDESVLETLKRDLVKILHKLEQVLIPKTTADQAKSLKSCKI